MKYSFFKISPWEEKGVLWLNILIGMAIIYKLFIPRFEVEREFQSSPKNDSIIAAYLLNKAQHAKDSNSTYVESTPKVDLKTKSSKTRKKLLPTSFDPNKLSRELALKMGLREYQWENLNRFVLAGGRVSKPVELFKIYGWDSSLVAHLIPFVKIDSTSLKPTKKQRTNRETIQSIEINTADTTAFKTLPGIGSVLAKRIIKFREALGGFVSKDQLFQVWGLDSAVLISNQNLLFLGDTSLVRLDINTSDYKELSKHPYLNYKQAKSIVAYRENHGEYSAIEQITNSVLIDQQDYLKIAPYLTISKRGAKD